MPTRILRDYTESAPFDGISAEAERLFVRLLMKADDFGRFHATPKLIKALCFPLSEDLRANTVAAWLTELSDRQLVFCYTSGAGSYLALPKFGQRLRAESRSKFPPPDGEPPNWHPPQSAASRGNPPQVTALCGVGVGDEGVSEDGDECEVGVQGERASPPPASDGVTLPTVSGGKKALPITDEWLLEIAPDYPHVTVPQQFTNAKNWVKTHPGRTLSRKFFIAWLNRIDPPPQVNGSKEPRSF
jgi:hypothetical protein